MLVLYCKEGQISSADYNSILMKLYSYCSQDIPEPGNPGFCVASSFQYGQNFYRTMLRNFAMWNYIVLQYKTLQWEFGGIVVFIVLQCIECKGHTSPKHGGMLIP